MAKRIKIKFDGKELEAELNDTKTAKTIYASLPLSAIANTWGEEIYFSIPVEPQEEPGREEVKVGDLAYWPPGRVFCIFFGRTPASTSDKPRAASAVTVVGKITKNMELLGKAKSGDKIKLAKG